MYVCMYVCVCVFVYMYTLVTKNFNFTKDKIGFWKLVFVGEYNH
jgi:hypothetical protein